VIRRASCALWLGWALLACADTLDRIAVTIDKHVISERDILQNIRTAAFLDGASPDFSGAAKRKAAERLVDQYEVLQDAALTRTTLASAADAAPLLIPIKARYPSPAGYSTALAQAGITEDELANHLLAGLRLLRYTDTRFRPEVQISENALRDAYAKMGGTRSFAESRAHIEKLLTDQQVMESLDKWLAMARGETRIVYRDAVFQDAAARGGVSP
jgi:hypothetical protein